MLKVYYVYSMDLYDVIKKYKYVNIYVVNLLMLLLKIHEIFNEKFLFNFILKI